MLYRLADAGRRPAIKTYEQQQKLATVKGKSMPAARLGKVFLRRMKEENHLRTYVTKQLVSAGMAEGSALRRRRASGGVVAADAWKRAMPRPAVHMGWRKLSQGKRLPPDEACFSDGIWAAGHQGCVSLN